MIPVWAFLLRTLHVVGCRRWKTRVEKTATTRLPQSQSTRFEISVCQQAFKSDPLSALNRAPIQEGEAGWEAMTSKTHWNRLATSKDR